MCVLLLLANLGSMSFNIYVIALCPWQYCSYFCAKFYNSHDLLDALVRSTTDFNYTINGTHDPHVSLPGIKNWNVAIIFSAAFSAFVSYYMMVFLVLLPLYSKVFCCCFHRDNGLPSWMKVICTTWDLPFKRHEDILLPFCDKHPKKEKQSTALDGSQKMFFLSYFIVNILIFGSSLGVFIKILHDNLSKSDTKTEIDINESGLMFQFISQFCAIQSCFIFSKIAYGVSNKQHKLVEQLKQLDLSTTDFRTILGLATDDINWSQNDQVPVDVKDLKEFFSKTREIFFNNIFGDGDNPPAPDEFYTERAHLAILKRIDFDFIKNIKASLTPYSHWFTVHWFLYTLTTFMSIAFIVETYTPDSNKSSWHSDSEKVWIFSYIVLFCLTHAFLFIYPCFCAAMITASRSKAIKHLASHEWKHLSISVQNSFLYYLKSENFGFKIPFFCIHDVTFGFNLAFVSIFIEMIGMIIKLSSL